MLQNAAKRGKLMESYGNFGGARFGAPGDDFSHDGPHLIRLTVRSVAKIK
jgi:hypothetical protein